MLSQAEQTFEGARVAAHPQRAAAVYHELAGSHPGVGRRFDYG